MTRFGFPKFFKRPLFIIPAVFIILIIAAAVYFTREKPPVYEFVAAERGELVQEVSVTGRVKPAESVELAFEVGGKVSLVYAAVGDSVKAGQIIAGLANGELAAQLLAAQADLEAEEAKLKELKSGARPEEIRAAETKVANARRSLDDAEADLVNAKNKADIDLKKTYDDALTAVQKSVSVGKTALLTLTSIQYAHFGGSDEDSNTLANAKAAAVKSLLGADGAGRFSQKSVSDLVGGAFGAAQNAVNDPVYINIDGAITQTLEALQKTKQALGAVPVSDVLTTTERTDLATEKNNINAEITNASGKEQAIAVQKVTNDKNIAQAQAGVNTAKNNLSVAEDDLALKKAGTVMEKITAQEAAVDSVRANMQKIQAQIAKTVIRAPIDGIITKQDFKVGEIVAAGATLASLISENEFEIETNVPEIDVAKVKIGDSARVTLDAYGGDVLFEARVVSVDPAETVIEGVSTYKTTLQFAEEDGRVRSGMTANINILTDRRENVIAVPGRAVITKDGEKFVRILTGEIDEKDNPVVLEAMIKTGIRGSGGDVEIIEGIKEGDKVIVFEKE